MRQKTVPRFVMFVEFAGCESVSVNEAKRVDIFTTYPSFYSNEINLSLLDSCLINSGIKF